MQRFLDGFDTLDGHHLRCHRPSPYCIRIILIFFFLFCVVVKIETTPPFIPHASKLAPSNISNRQQTFNEMPPQSRGNLLPTGFQSISTPNLPTANPLGIQTGEESQSPVISSAQPHSPSEATTPSEPASLEDSIEDLPLNGEYLTSDSECSDSLEEDSVVSEAGPGNTTHHRRPYYSNQSSRSLPPSSTSLFPPFYNRPPTPLPPSPSLTSLLRPSFSTQTSRPTTPETSDTESHSAAGHSAAKAHHRFG